ncbi:hypothetical protein NX059_008697 [Plenodomus lindquistii]|nr:hypothetical protein NX059_008697 [Plenodomus lindquistii]
MKLFTIISTIVLAGIAQADLNCTCTGGVQGNPAVAVAYCCSDGFSNPDGVIRPGQHIGESAICQVPTDYLGFTSEEMLQSWSTCCGNTGEGMREGWEGACSEATINWV